MTLTTWLLTTAPIMLMVGLLGYLGTRRGQNLQQPVNVVGEETSIANSATNLASALQKQLDQHAATSSAHDQRLVHLEMRLDRMRMAGIVGLALVVGLSVGCGGGMVGLWRLTRS